MKHIFLVVLMWAVVIVGQIPFIGEQDWFDYFANGVFITLLVIPVLILFPLLGLLFLFSFNSGLYKIHNEWHYSGFRFKPFFENGPKWFVISLYNGWHSAPKNGQINKIVGKAWGFPVYDKERKRWIHANSLRVGMKLASIGVYEIFYYGYFEGAKLPNISLGLVNKRERFQVEVSKDILEGIASRYLRNKYEKRKSKIVKSDFGYYLFPYHGGEFPAFEKCTVDIYKYNKKSSVLGLRYLQIKTV